MIKPIHIASCLLRVRGAFIYQKIRKSGRGVKRVDTATADSDARLSPNMHHHIAIAACGRFPGKPGRTSDPQRPPPGASLRIGEETLDRGRERLGIVRQDEKAGVAEDLGRGGRVGRYDGQTGRHRLEKHEAEGLVARGETEQVRLAEVTREGGAIRDISEEDDGIAQAEFPGEGEEAWGVDPSPDDVRSQTAHSGSRPRDGAQERVDPFARIELCNREYGRSIAGPRRRRHQLRVPCVEIESMRDREDSCGIDVIMAHDGCGRERAGHDDGRRRLHISPFRNSLMEQRGTRRLGLRLRQLGEDPLGTDDARRAAPRQGEAIVVDRQEDIETAQPRIPDQRGIPLQAAIDEIGIIRIEIDGDRHEIDAGAREPRSTR